MRQNAASSNPWIFQYRADLFLGSVLCGCALGTIVSLSWVWCIGIASALLLGTFFLRKKRTIFIILCCSLFFVIGVARGGGIAPQNRSSSLGVEDARVVITGVVSAEPRISKFNQQIRLNLEYMVEPSARELQGVVLVETGFTPRIHAGERMVVSCRARPISAITSPAFAALLKRTGISDVCSSAIIQEHSEMQGSIAGIAAHVRETIAQQIRTTFPSPESDLLSGILIGADQQFSEDIKKAFQVSGLTHIVAVSGSNITLMIFFLQTFLGSLGISRKSQFGILGFFICAFTLVSGASSSAVRAMIMGLLGVTATQLGRAPTVLRAILIAAVVMAFIDPSVVFFDLSFQLSFLATLGLVYITPKLERILAWVPEHFSLRTTLAQTCAAILATEPLILYHFGTLSLIAPLMNVLIIPAIPLVMALGGLWLLATFAELGLGMLIGGVLPISLQWVFAWPTWALLHTIVWCVSFAKGIPYASLTLQSGPLLAIVLGLFIGLAGTFLLQSRVRKSVN